MCLIEARALVLAPPDALVRLAAVDEEEPIRPGGLGLPRARRPLRCEGSARRLAEGCGLGPQRLLLGQRALR